jgi:hypothetical protein
LKNVKDKEKADFYICGSNEFIADFKRELKENNIERINTMSGNKLNNRRV